MSGPLPGDDGRDADVPLDDALRDAGGPHGGGAGAHAATGTRPASAVGPRRRAWEIVEAAREGDRTSLACDVFVQGLIAANVIALIVSTMDDVHAAWRREFAIFEHVSVALFSVEYLVRLWSCVSDERYTGGPAGRLRWARSPMALVDLLAILPSWLPMVGLDLRFMRALRLMRLLKLSRYSKPLLMFRRVVRRKRDQLVATLFLLAMALLFASSLMYFAEHDSQPEVFSSIPKSMWWGMVTLSTVGYGDMYPVTPLGRVVGACIAILGVLMFALPTAILGSAFMEEFELQRAERRCPHCGERIEE